MKETSERNVALDILKGMGIISMIMGHSNMGPIFEIYIAGFHMQLFFIVSGYLFCPEKYNSFFLYSKRKVRSILLPYFFFTVVTILFCEVENVILGERIYSINSYFLGMIWSNRSIFPVTGAIWFLQCTFWIELFYYLIEKIKSKTITNIVVICALTGSIFLELRNIKLPLALDSALSGLVFYHIGFIVKQNRIFEKNKRIINPPIGLLLIVTIINAFLIYFNKPVNPRTCEYSFVPLYYINALVGFWIWLCISSKLHGSKVVLLRKLSDAAMTIGKDSIFYLGFNQIIIHALYKSISMLVLNNSSIFRAGRNIFICLLTIVACYTLSKVIVRSPLSVVFGKKKQTI